MSKFENAAGGDAAPQLTRPSSTGVPCSSWQLQLCGELESMPLLWLQWARYVRLRRTEIPRQRSITAGGWEGLENGHEQCSSSQDLLVSSKWSQNSGFRFVHVVSICWASTMGQGAWDIPVNKRVKVPTFGMLTFHWGRESLHYIGGKTVKKYIFCSKWSLLRKKEQMEIGRQWFLNSHWSRWLEKHLKVRKWTYACLGKKAPSWGIQFSSVTQSCPALCNPMDYSTPGFPVHCWNPCPLSWWCHPTISSSVIPFSCLQFFPASGSFPMSQLFAAGGQSIGAPTSVLPMSIQGWFSLGLTDLTFLHSKTLKSLHQNHSS